MKIQKLKCNDRRPRRTPHGILFTTAALLSLLAVVFSAAGQSISWEPVEAPRTGIAVTPAASATTTIERAAARDQYFYTKTGRLPDTFEAPFMPLPARALEGQRVDPKSAAPLDAPPALPPSPAPPAFTEGFLATTSGATPPDTNGAVGPDHLMVILNSGITIQDKQGNKLSSATLTSFWGDFPDLDNVFDPKVIYDPLADRFLAVAVANRRASDSAILIAVSSTSDPMDPWGQWLFDADPGGTMWLDFPYIGMTQDKITFTSNLFTNADDTFLGSVIWVVDKSTALDGGAITTTSFSNSDEAAPAPALPPGRLPCRRPAARPKMYKREGGRRQNDGPGGFIHY